MIITPPMTQEMMAAGPAAMSPFWAPNSHPEPMMEPTEAQISPILPTSRTSDVERCGRGDVAVPDMSDQLSREVAPRQPIKLRRGGPCAPSRRGRRVRRVATRRRRPARRDVQLHDESRQHDLHQWSDRDGVEDGADADDTAQHPADRHHADLQPGAHQPDRDARTPVQPGHQAVPRTRTELGTDVE